ncbi:chitin synthase-domain-containing protein [Fimicolochytrium jonesii]|uniref:chitin synthase-domain-containing protein n=1 Tax=Fimicolochytrium jonesii TaxID=1396493 RepID=UPI0022FE3053|nr:chitin synthase-domain-containing protein [Fimicolochytrium jonesii]KAI8824195.1 chitin synthase-domain-containing protein [Fimicolochytrium jonesii]
MVRPGRSGANPFSATATQAATANSEGCEDLSLPATPFTVEQVTRNLVARLSNGEHYTRVGARCLLALSSSRNGSDALSKEYADAYKQSPGTVSHPPHVFHIASSAYRHMVRSQQDQCVILSGESGSGKSQSHRFITRHLCDLSKTSLKKSKVHSAVLKVDSVLSAFGNAQTPFNTDASCYTRYAEYQFDKRGKMVGLKLVDYLLEKSRVTGAEDGGRSFHIFYYLLAGATPDEKMQLHLSDPAHFHYLNQSTVRVATADSLVALDELRDNLKSLGIGRRQQAQLWQLLAAILHLGNITFHDDPNNTQESCSVRNYAQLELVASLLGLHPAAIEAVLTYRTKRVGRDITSIFLNADGAEKQRDSFARSLYAVAFSWIIEQLNNKLCQEESAWSTFLAVLDAPGFAGRDITGNGFHRLLVNYENEKLHSLINEQLFDLPRIAFTAEGLAFSQSDFTSNRETLAVLSGPKTGVLQIIDQEAARGTKDSKINEKLYGAHGQTDNTAFVAAKKPKHSFGIRHYAGAVEYDTRGFSDSDSDILQSDFVTLVRGSPEQAGTANMFLRAMFSDRLIATHASKRDGKAVSASSKGRNPSVKHRRNKKGQDVEEESSSDPSDTVGYQFRHALGELLPTLSDAQSWVIYHLRINDDISSRNVDQEAVRRQVQYYDILALTTCTAVVYTFAMTHAEFLKRYAVIVSPSGGDNRQKVHGILLAKDWKEKDAVVGSSRVFLSEAAWKALELQLAAQEAQEVDAKDSYDASVYARSEHSMDDNISHYESEMEFEREPRKSSSQIMLIKNGVDLEGGYGGSEKSFSPLAKDGVVVNEVPVKAAKKPKKKMTGTRCRWLCCTWMTTGLIPPFCLWIFGMKQKDRQMAWREKVALCFIIFLMNCAILFFIIGMGYFICPKKAELSPGQVSSKVGLDGTGMVHLYGSYYTVASSLINDEPNHPTNQALWKDNILGHDIRQLFPKLDATGSNFASVCPGFTKPTTFQEFVELPPLSWSPHSTAKVDPSSRKGTVVWGPESFATAPSNRYLIAYDRVYDVTPIEGPNSLYKQQRAGGPSFLETDNTRTGGADNYVSNKILNRASNNPGDSTADFEKLRTSFPQDFASIKNCMDNLFYVGQVDHRNDLQCQVPNYVMLVASIIIVAVVGFKFLAALQFTTKRNPEEHDKFIICQVPCYTEGEASLLRTLESLATLDYDDKHKLLFVICDGNIVGSGNDRPTPRIVLDILGVDPNVEPESLSFQSLGDGNKQLNMGKIYSGLYEIQGKVVPYIVVVKVGKPTERQRPGNRGKRDSQLLLMRFLSRVHFNQAMNPLELELYHQMKNVIGVDPSFYEYIFMVDADTEVYKDSLNRLVSNMARDSKIAGICGETQISNERDSWVSMIQVYEYFISHNMAKAFESLFGSVTCLPGCFSMYRVRTPVKNIPLLISPTVIKDYSENVVDTLHLKNLLHLGEDRYLTTLMLKHFPNMKTSFTGDAKCKTNAPDRWSVLLSQRRRWINSTVHNLLELLWLPEMCGFCCFSMRFVVFLDLFATFVQPAALGYIVYLVWSVATQHDSQFPLISIIMLGALYGFQMIIFLLKREWQHIGWMIIYILAMPIFGAFIPLYSFWHFDDFSWGNTRQVEEGGKVVEKPVAEEDFDPKSIPLRKWADFEPERLELEADTRSRRSSYHSGSAGGSSGRSKGHAASAYSGSVYGGGASVYGGSVYGGGPGSVYGGSQYGGAPYPAPPYPGAPSIDAYTNRMSWGTHYSGHPGAQPDFSGLPPVPPPGAAQPLARKSSQRSAYSASSDSAPRALPSDDEILRQVRHILSTADLMTVTKKSVREDLSKFFGVDLSAKKEWIHRCIDGVLKGEL